MGEAFSTACWRSLTCANIWRVFCDVASDAQFGAQFYFRSMSPAPSTRLARWEFLLAGCFAWTGYGTGRGGFSYRYTLRQCVMDHRTHQVPVSLPLPPRMHPLYQLPWSATCSLNSCLLSCLLAGPVLSPHGVEGIFDARWPSFPQCCNFSRRCSFPFSLPFSNSTQTGP